MFRFEHVSHAFAATVGQFDAADYRDTLSAEIRRTGIKPSGVVRLYDAVLCRNMGMEFCDPKELLCRSGMSLQAYISGLTSLRNGSTVFPALFAADIDGEVHLFGSRKRFAGYLRSRMEMHDNRQGGSLAVYMLAPLDKTLLDRADTWTNDNKGGEPPLDGSVLSWGMCCACFDMTPTEESRQRLATTCNSLFGLDIRGYGGDAGRVTMAY